MTNYWKRLWQRASAPDSKDNIEVERTAALQQAASPRRAEYAAEKERAGTVGGE